MSAITVCCFRFYGNADVKRKVSQWRRALKACANLKDPILVTERCAEILEIRLRSEFLGSFIEYSGDFHFLCNRLPILEVPKLLLKQLSTYDKEVIVEVAYEFEGDFGYKFLANSVNGKLFDKVHGEISAFRIDWDAHGEIYFDEGNDDGGDDIPQFREALEQYYLIRISNIEKLRSMFPATDGDLSKRERCVRRHLKLALANKAVRLKKSNSE
jgi:hypothetical protein